MLLLLPRCRTSTGPTLPVPQVTTQSHGLKQGGDGRQRRLPNSDEASLCVPWDVTGVGPTTRAHADGRHPHEAHHLISPRNHSASCCVGSSGGQFCASQAELVGSYGVPQNDKILTFVYRVVMIGHTCTEGSNASTKSTTVAADSRAPVRDCCYFLQICRASMLPGLLYCKKKGPTC